MYNRYIPNGASYTRVPVPDPLPRQNSALPSPPHREAPSPEPTSHQKEVSDREVPNRERQSDPHRSKRQASLSSLLSGLGKGSKNAGLTGIFEKLKLDDIDTGDILLILILLFLFRDGDDLELVIALGLLLLLGLGDKEESQSGPS